LLQSITLPNKGNIHTVAIATMGGTLPLTCTLTSPILLTATIHLHCGYDAANRRTGLTYYDGRQASWSYDAAGRSNQVTQPRWHFHGGVLWRR
jgi:YD repeat-containing protein